jgi:hypothetical protein
LKDKKAYSIFAAFVVLLLFISTGLNTFAQTPIWSDEFDGSSLDTTKWTIIDAEDWNVGGDSCWYAPHNVEVSGGTLKLHSVEEIYGSAEWTGAKLEGKYHPQYKYLEARVRQSAADTYIGLAE